MIERKVPVRIDNLLLLSASLGGPENKVPICKVMSLRHTTYDIIISSLKVKAMARMQRADNF